MANQYLNGKAFEYACLTAFYNSLSTNQTVIIEDTLSLKISEEAFNKLDYKFKLSLEQAAKAAVNFIIRAEPMLIHQYKNNPLYLRIQEDKFGQAGDVRDILMIRRLNGWEIGLSVKHNSFAIKHSRLSKTIDFSYKWLGIPSSPSYFAEINPIFDELVLLRKDNVKWSNIPDKQDKYYVPILKAFINELKKQNDLFPDDVPPKLLSYLIGKNDFYKIIADKRNRSTKIQAFSLYGKLNRSAGHVSPEISIPRLRLPRTIYAVEFCPNSKNTVRIVYDEGWTIMLRIHNASTFVEPSLKFDITLNGTPSNMYSHDEPW